ncbi:MAG: hypothetical protein RJA61_387 [Candidatus Parcubacteria bacterium]|jgi:hypothetical protein
MPAMISNIECLIEACKELKIPYSFLDKNKNCVAVGKQPFSYFINASNPLNNESVAVLVKDKEFAYKALEGSVQMPYTKAYFDPAHDEYGSYKTFTSEQEILEDIAKSFELPLMLKRNKGARTVHVFKCSTKEEAGKALNTIFDQKNKDYDYVALAQTFIPSNTEYRVIVLDGAIELVYKKNLDVGEAKQVIDSVLIQKIQNFIDPIFKTIPLRWSGLDIISGTDGNLHLLELNSKPGFGYFLQNHDKKIIVEIYKNILKKLLASSC